MSEQRFDRINTAAPNLMVVCFDHSEGSDGVGKLYDYYSREAALFANEYQLVKLMEGVMERVDYPQASTEMRIYDRGRKRAQGTSAPRELPRKKERPDKAVGHEELLAHRGELATFVVWIQYRQNSTWQGTLLWAERGETRSFRSALEMLKIMDNAIG